MKGSITWRSQVVDQVSGEDSSDSPEMNGSDCTMPTQPCMQGQYPAAGQKGDRETPQEVSRHAQAELEQLEVAKHRVCVLMSILTTMVAQGEYF